MHGRIGKIAKINDLAVRLGIKYVVQAGDFGLYWPGGQCPVRKFFHKREWTDKAYTKVEWHIVLGNHDVYPRYDFGDGTKVCNPYRNLFIYPRNATPIIAGHRFLCFGGAISSDAHERIENKSWWAAEGPSQAEYEKFLDLTEKETYDYVVTHDGPIDFPYNVSMNPLHKPNRSTNEVSRFLQMALPGVNCSTWFFGHHHQLLLHKYHDMKIVCTGKHGDGVIVNGKADINKLNFIHGNTNYYHRDIVEIKEEMERQL